MCSLLYRFYDKSKVRTGEGSLLITTTAEKISFAAQNDQTLKYYTAEKNFKSAMVQSWNKFCFTGGIMEARSVPRPLKTVLEASPPS